MRFPRHTAIRLILFLPYLYPFLICWTNGTVFHFERLPWFLTSGLIISIINLVDFKQVTINFTLTLLNFLLLLPNLYLFIAIPPFFWL